MASLFGFLELGVRPAAAGVLATMGAAALELRPGKRREIVQGRLGLGTDCPAGGPAAEPRLGRVAAFEGRIDNKAELEYDLSLDASSSEAELVLAAYERWGADCAARLVGAFTLAVWDPLEERLLCCRDAMGEHLFFYALSRRRVLFASQLRQILRAFERRPPLDEDYLADFLLTGDPSLDRTPYQDIRKLPPGHALVVDRGRALEVRYWRPELRPPVHYPDPRDYAAEFLSRLRDGVLACLRSESPVWSDLSGGLDSSSVVCLAQEIIRSGQAEVPEFATLTALFDPPGSGEPPEFVQSVLDKYAVESHILPAYRFSAFEDMIGASAYYDEPNHQIRFFSYALRQKEMLERAGVRVLLRGIGAEVAVLTENPKPLHLPDLLRTLRLSQFISDLIGWQKALGVPLLNLLRQYVLAPMTGPPLDRYHESPVIPAWVKPAFAARCRLQGRLNLAVMPDVFESVGNQWQYEKVGRISNFLDRGYMEAAVESRHPFLHRPLVEYTLAVPYEYKVLPGHFKPLLRRAMAGILPDAVRFRQDKGRITPWVIRSLARNWDAVAPFLKDPVLGALGFIDPGALLREFEDFRVGRVYRSVLLGSVLSLEVWLRYTLGESATRKEAAKLLPHSAGGA